MEQIHYAFLLNNTTDAIVFRHLVEAAHYGDCASQKSVWALSRKHILEERAVSAGAFHWDYEER